MTKEKKQTRVSGDERYFSKCYHDFMDSKLLNGEEKIIFLVLKRFLDVTSDHGNVFPTIKTIQDMTGWGNQKIIKYIDSLVKKGIVKKIRQGYSKPNIYVLSDYPETWDCDSTEDTAETAEKKDPKSWTPEEHIAELEKMGYRVEVKKPDTTATCKETVEPDLNKQNKNHDFVENNTVHTEKSQEAERCTAQCPKSISFLIMMS